MPRISGVDLPRKKQTWVALTYIYGIGRTTALKICDEAQVDPHLPNEQLSDQQVVRIRQVITDSYRVEGDLRRDISVNIKRLMTWAAIAVCVIVAASQFEANEPTPTLAPGRDRVALL